MPAEAFNAILFEELKAIRNIAEGEVVMNGFLGIKILLRLGSNV
jgi:hypothetical protein